MLFQSCSLLKNTIRIYFSSITVCCLESLRNSSTDLLQRESVYYNFLFLKNLLPNIETTNPLLNSRNCKTTQLFFLLLLPFPVLLRIRMSSVTNTS